ncbi:MIP/aquaporin family protein [Haloglycomyces albus]|uniref:MIP/aquaporin family protein n=1 Tax=Haloglycomyces albus TaxID=526067 RepID=UPI00046CF23E|nr:MIP/aquaporin family protein [Haloglycomyces albus]
MEYLAEFIGTAMLVLLGNGVVAGVVLKKSKAEAAGWVVITLGWGLAVALAVYSVGHVSGAHINPAVTIGLASVGQFEWSMVPGYLAAQLAGGAFGALLVYMHYLKHWAVTDDSDAKLAAYSTSPAIKSTPANFISEFIGTFVLVFGVLAIGANGSALGSVEVNLQEAYSTGMAPLLTGLLVVAIGMSLGGPTGYAINPARDLGPRIMHAVLPISGKGSSEWAYAWIPVVAPITGGVVGALAWQATGFGF